MKSKMQDWLASKSFASEMTQWIISIVFALTVALGFIFVVLQFVDWYYISRHPIALTEEDLGYGLVMISSLLLTAIGVIPITGLLLWRFKKFLSKLA